MVKAIFYGLVVLTSILAAQSAFGNASSRQVLNSMRPANYVSAGQCDVQIDCPHYRITINGEYAGQIVCAKHTGANFNGKVVRLAKYLHPSSGKYMPKGFPMLPTEPSLCSGCYIHAYPWVGPGHKSLGCVGITQAAWDKIVRCGGSQIAFRAMNGAVAAIPGTTNVADSGADNSVQDN